MKSKMPLVFACGVLAGSLLSGNVIFAAQKDWKYIKVLNETLKMDIAGTRVPNTNLIDYNNAVYVPVNRVATMLGGKAVWSKWLPGVNLVHIPRESKNGAVIVNGNPVSGAHPIILNGQAYVPAASVGAALGVPQTFSSKIQTEYFGPQPKGSLLVNILKPYYWTGFQSNLANTSSGGWGNNLHMEMGGVIYNNGIKMDIKSTLNASLEPVKVYYNLQSRYRKITGTVGLDDSSPSQNSIKFSLFGNGKLLDHLTLKPGQLPLSFSINISGVKQLVLEADPVSSQGDVFTDLANVRVY